MDAAAGGSNLPQIGAPINAPGAPPNTPLAGPQNDQQAGVRNANPLPQQPINPPQPHPPRINQHMATLGEYDAPNALLNNRNPIAPPAPQRRNYTISPQLIGLVKQNQFHGYSQEHPMDHIDLFEDICSTTRANGIPRDFMKLKLFPFSLTGKALRWLKSLPAGSLTTWEACRSVFIRQFYPKTKSNQLRDKIARFQQLPAETFYEAWERFREYIRECPHHGFSEHNLLRTFHRGLHENHRNQLNTASNGDFMTKTVDDAYTLIGNLAASSFNSDPEYDRSVREPYPDKKDSTHVNTMIDSKIKQLTNKLLQEQQQAVNFVDYTEIGDMMQALQTNEPIDQQEDINFIGGQFNYQNKGVDANFRN